MRDYLMVPPGRPGTLRVDVDDEWRFGDFGKTFTTIESAYLRLSAFLHTEPDFDSRRRQLIESQVEVSEFRRDHILGSAQVTHSARSDAPDVLELRALTPTLAALFRQTQRALAPMRLGHVQIDSPGFLEGIGELNPLAVIEHFVTSWRTESRLRVQQKLDIEVKRIELELQRRELDIKSATQRAEGERDALRLALEVAAAMPDGAEGDVLRKQIADRALQLALEGSGGAAWMSYLLRTADREMRRISEDQRIRKIALEIEGKAS
jgi:hypothetical protein